MTEADVTAVIPTRGDVDLSAILASLIWGNVVVYDNSVRPDMGAFGRYLAAFETDAAVVYTQDDDCVVSPEAQCDLLCEYQPDELLSNMDPGHNAGKPLLALPGWGALFAPRLAADAFLRWDDVHRDGGSDDFRRVGCDIVFPVLTPSRMIDVGHTDLPWAWNKNRTHVQAGYRKKKDWYYDEARKIRERD